MPSGSGRSRHPIAFARRRADFVPVPRLKGSASVRGERCAAFLPTFADASHVGTMTEMHRSPLKGDQLGKTQACLGGKQQQGMIAASEPCCLVRSGKNRLDLGARQ